MRDLAGCIKGCGESGRWVWLTGCLPSRVMGTYSALPEGHEGSRGSMTGAVRPREGRGGVGQEPGKNRAEVQ